VETLCGMIEVLGVDEHGDALPGMNFRHVSAYRVPM